MKELHVDEALDELARREGLDLGAVGKLQSVRVQSIEAGRLDHQIVMVIASNLGLYRLVGSDTHPNYVRVSAIPLGMIAALADDMRVMPILNR